MFGTTISAFFSVDVQGGSNTGPHKVWLDVTIEPTHILWVKVQFRWKSMDKTRYKELKLHCCHSFKLYSHVKRKWTWNENLFLQSIEHTDCANKYSTELGSNPNYPTDFPRVGSTTLQQKKHETEPRIKQKIGWDFACHGQSRWITVLHGHLNDLLVKLPDEEVLWTGISNLTSSASNVRWCCRAPAISISLNMNQQEMMKASAMWDRRAGSKVLNQQQDTLCIPPKNKRSFCSQAQAIPKPSSFHTAHVC